MSKLAILALEDGSVFRGLSIGADGQSSGEVVFNTAMTGYQEILTDPSYCQQMVTLTYPHIGNTGTNPEDAESAQVWAAGLIIRDLPLLSSNWRNKQPLDEYLKENGTVAIAGIDTRRLTRILREKGSQNGCILAGADATEEKALELARSFPGLKGMDLAKVVSTDKPYAWKDGQLDLDRNEFVKAAPQYKVVAYDFGVNIVTFEPGASIPFAETHVMEHGLYVLEGKAVYRLNQDWVEVEAGDYMWLRAFCPQACYSGGPGKFRYLLYKDVNRHMDLGRFNQRA